MDDQNLDTTEDSFAKIFAIEFGKGVGITIGTYAVLCGVGYAYATIRERKEKKTIQDSDSK